MEILTDSSSVYAWLRSIMGHDQKVKIRGLNEVIVRRRLELLRTCFDECGFNPKVTLVPSQKNKADELTCLPQTWWKYKNSFVPASTSVDKTSLISEVHKLNHFDVNRTLCFVQHFHPRIQVSRSDVDGVVVFYLLNFYSFAWLVM